MTRKEKIAKTRKEKIANIKREYRWMWAYQWQGKWILAWRSEHKKQNLLDNDDTPWPGGIPVRVLLTPEIGKGKA
ncbi:MAG: hypothetical protein Q8Q12_00595 [bacterium]|nr:hypothetical protein [bacterium]